MFSKYFILIKNWILLLFMKLHFQMKWHNLCKWIFWGKQNVSPWMLNRLCWPVSITGSRKSFRFLNPITKVKTVQRYYNEYLIVVVTVFFQNASQKLLLWNTSFVKNHFPPILNQGDYFLKKKSVNGKLGNIARGFFKIEIDCKKAHSDLTFF